MWIKSSRRKNRRNYYASDLRDDYNIVKDRAVRDWWVAVSSSQRIPVKMPMQGGPEDYDIEEKSMSGNFLLSDCVAFSGVLMSFHEFCNRLHRLTPLGEGHVKRIEYKNHKGRVMLRAQRKFYIVPYFPEYVDTTPSTVLE